MAPAARTDAPVDLEGRVVEGMLACIGRWGIAKTTLDDVAREAGCSRATVYRTFPGGKDRIVEAVTRHEVLRFFASVGAGLDEAETLEDLLTQGITEAVRFVTEHEALRYLLMHEPELVLPNFAFHRLDKVLALAAGFAAPHLARFMPADDAAAAGDWVARVVLSYSLNPSGAVDPRDPASVRHLVRTFLVPGLTPRS